MKKNNLFELAHIHELPSIFNRDISINEEMLKACTLGYLVVFQYRSNSETVGLHVSVRYMTPEDKVLMQEGATVVAKIDGWTEMSHDEATLRGDLRIRSFIGYGLAFVSGMVFRRASGTVMNNVFVPYMSVDSVIDDVVIEELKGKE